MQKVLILGATSSISRELALLFARDGAALYLGARDLDDAARIAADIRVRAGTPVSAGSFDAADRAGHAKFISDAIDELGGLDVVALCFGNSDGLHQAEHHPARTLKIIEENFSGAASLLTLISDHFEQQRSGSIIVIGSVAGERGRRDNYIYSSAKSALAIFAQGLRARLFSAGVTVMTVKLGLVDTKMTWGRRLTPFMISPREAAAQIYRAWQRGAEVVFVPAIWRPIMAAIRLAPERLMKRLQLSS